MRDSFSAKNHPAASVLLHATFTTSVLLHFCSSSFQLVQLGPRGWWQCGRAWGGWGHAVGPGVAGADSVGRLGWRVRVRARVTVRVRACAGPSHPPPRQHHKRDHTRRPLGRPRQPLPRSGPGPGGRRPVTCTRLRRPARPGPTASGPAHTHSVGMRRPSESRGVHLAREGTRGPPAIVVRAGPAFVPGTARERLGSDDTMEPDRRVFAAASVREGIEHHVARSCAHATCNWAHHRFDFRKHAVLQRDSYRAQK